MRKIFLIIVPLGFFLVLAFIVFLGYQFYKNFNRAKTPNELAIEAYWKLHHKNINQTFLVDSMAYNVTGFKYYQKKDSTILIADIFIINKTTHSKRYIDSFFLLKNGINKMYYPKQEQFSVFENATQPLKLIYFLPERIGTYLSYDLHIISKKDTAQNGLVSFYENYRAGG